MPIDCMTICDMVITSRDLVAPCAACILGAVANASRTVRERRVAAAALAAAASPGAVAAPSTRADADGCPGAPRLAQPQQLLGRCMAACLVLSFRTDWTCVRFVSGLHNLVIVCMHACLRAGLAHS
jgi:hypothetical protein